MTATLSDTYYSLLAELHVGSHPDRWPDFLNSLTNERNATDNYLAMHCIWNSGG